MLQVLKVSNTYNCIRACRYIKLSMTGINPVEIALAMQRFINTNRSFFRLQVRLKTDEDANLNHNNPLYLTPNINFHLTPRTDYASSLTL